MEFTGERFIPVTDRVDLALEHWHRYLLAASFVLPGRILDVGCGEGYGTSMLAKHAREVVGLDLDPNAVSHAQNRYQGSTLRFIKGSAQAIGELFAREFDSVICLEVFEHLSECDQERFLHGVTEVLRPGGHLIISTPNKPVYSDRANYQNPYHKHEVDFSGFYHALKACFPSVVIFGQRLYATSHIWRLDKENQETTIASLGSKDGMKQPEGHTPREAMYHLAVCSNDNLDPNVDSLLVASETIADLNAILRRESRRQAN